MGKQGGFFEEVVCDSYSRVCDSNERLKEYLEGALRKAGLESFVTVMPRRDGYRIYTGEKPDAPFVYVDVYLDGESVVVEGSSKRNLSESEMGDLARFLGISGKEAGEKLNKFRRFIDVLQKHAGEDVDKLEDLKVSDAVYVDAKNRNGGSPVRYMSGERLGRPVNHARPSGSGVTRGRDYVSKVDGGQRVGKPVQRAKVSDSKASDLSKISGALKLVKENFKVSGKPAEIKGITLDLKDLGGAIVSVKAYSKDKEPKITVEARTSDGKRRGFDYGIDAKASHVYGDLASLGKVEDSTPARWYQGQRVGVSAVSDGDTKISVSGDIDRSLWFDTVSKRLHEDSAFTVEDDTKDLVSGYYKLGDGNEGHISLYPDKIVFYSYENPSDADSDPYETVVPFDFYKKVESLLALLWFVQAADDAYDFIDVVQSVKKANIGVSDSAKVSDSVYVSESGLTPEFVRPGVVNPYQDADWVKTSDTINWDGVDLMSLGQTIGYLGSLGKQDEKGRDLYGIEYFSPNGRNHSISELIKEDYDRNLAQAKSFVEEHKDDPYYASSMKWVVDSSDDPGIDMTDLLLLLHGEGYTFDQAGDGSIEVFIPVESGGVKFDFESTNLGLRSALNGKLNVAHISVFDGDATVASWKVPTPGLSELKDLLGDFEAFGGDASDTIAAAVRILNSYFDGFNVVAVNDSADAPRTDCIFPKDSPDVNDGKCHYPLNSLARARAAIAYANKMTEKPTWYSGDLDVAGLVKKIVNAAKAAYPSIDVSPESYEPKKD